MTPKQALELLKQIIDTQAQGNKQMFINAEQAVIVLKEAIEKNE